MYRDRKKLCSRQLQAGKTRGRATFHANVFALVSGTSSFFHTKLYVRSVKTGEH